MALTFSCYLYLHWHNVFPDFLFPLSQSIQRITIVSLIITFAVLLLTIHIIFLEHLNGKVDKFELPWLWHQTIL